jgi:ribosome-binding protein aMBF1 (putative translation factor)
MDGQDWIPVVARRRYTKKESTHNSETTILTRDSDRGERNRLAKLETSDVPLPKKKIVSESLQALVRKRIDMKLSQDKADAACSFPKHTFRDIEANRLIPSEEQKRRIQQQFDIQLKIVLTTA